MRWRTRPKRVVRLFSVNRRKVESIIERHLRQGLLDIGEAEAKEILEAYGFATPKGSIATTAEQAANIAEQLGYPGRAEDLVAGHPAQVRCRRREGGPARASRK